MAEEFVIEKFVAKIVVRCIGVLLLLAIVAYPLDWAVWRERVAHGGGMGSVQVDRFTVAELKGGKEAYYPNGIAAVPCSESLYPQGGYSVCWWLRRHTEAIERY